MQITKKILVMYLILIFLYSALPVQGKYGYYLSDISVGETENYLDLITRINCHYANSFMMDGKPYLIVAPGASWVYIIDILEEKLFQKLYCEALSYAVIAVDVSPNTGDVYLGSQTAGGALYRYSIRTQTIEYLGLAASFGVNAILNIVFDEEDNLYLGCAPVGKVVKYTQKTKTFTDLGTIMPAPAQHCYVAYYKNALYCVTNAGIEKLKKLDLSTNTITEIEAPEEIGPNSAPYRGTRVLNDRYMAVNYNVGDPYNNTAKLYIALYDLVEEKWVDVIESGENWRFPPATEDNKFYYSRNNYLCEYDLNTLKETKQLNPLSVMRGSEIFIDYPDFPGKSLISWSFSGQYNIYCTTEKKGKTVQVADNIVAAVGSPMHNAMGLSEDGKVYCGESQGMKAFEYNMVTGEKKLFHMAEPPGIGIIGDKVYFCTYPGAKLYILDTEKPYHLIPNANDPENNPRIWGNIGYNLNRTSVIIEAAGKVALGGYVSVSRGGGYLTIYDPDTDKADVYTDLCLNRTPMAMAYRDGLLYIGYSATTEGGLPDHESNWDPNSKIVVFDMATRKALKTIIPTVPGFSQPITLIKSMIFGSDGLLWCSYDGLVFALDPKTLETVKSVQAGPIGDYDGTRYLYPNELKEDPQTGFLFLSEPGAVVDMETMEYKSLGMDYTRLGTDGNLYGVIRGNSGGFFRTIIYRKSKSAEKEDLSAFMIHKTAFKAESNHILSNGYTTGFSAGMPYQQNGRLMVPFYETAKLLGATVKSTIFGFEAQLNGNSILFKGHSPYAWENGVRIRFGVTTQWKEGVLYVPFHVLAEGLKREYYERNGVVILFMNEFQEVADSVIYDLTKLFNEKE